MRVINARELRAQLEIDSPILMRPWTTDPDTVRDMVSRGLERRGIKRPGPDRRKDDECSS